MVVLNTRCSPYQPRHLSRAPPQDAENADAMSSPTRKPTVLKTSDLERMKQVRWPPDGPANAAYNSPPEGFLL